MARLLKFLAHGVFAIVGAYAVLTLAFAVVALTPDPHEAFIAHTLARRGQGDQIAAEIAAYRAARNLDVPVTTRYLRWLVDITVLDWGRSFQTGRPVLSVVREGAVYTLAYVVPSVFVGSVAGIWIGLRTAVTGHSVWTDRFSSLSYLAFGLPSFWIAAVFFVGLAPSLPWFPSQPPADGPFSVEGATFLAVPALILTANVFAGQLRYARAKGNELRSSLLVKQRLALGVGPRKIAWHVLRLCTVPLLSVSLADLIAILVVDVFVLELVFRIPGLGFLAYSAILDRDMPVVLGTTMFIALAGIGINFLQEVANTLLDPRIGDERSA